MDFSKHHNPWLACPSGQKFFPFTCWDSVIAIEDIAHGLAGKFRYAGLSNRWYTVAQHSVEVSCRFTDRTEALWGLMHDAAETWLLDLPSPIKPFVFVAIPLPNGRIRVVSYADLEEEILLEVAKTLHLPYPAPDSIHAVDMRERARERRDLFDSNQPAWEEMPKPYPETLVPLEPMAAKREFLARYRELTA